MLIDRYLSDSLPALQPDDSAEIAMMWMNLFHTAHLPVVEHKHYMGLVSYDALQHCHGATVADALQGMENAWLSPGLTLNQHIFDAVKFVVDANVDVAPILTTEGEYAGCINRNTLIRLFSEVVAADDPGEIIILEIPRGDYSLARIAAIVESDGGRILHASLSSSQEFGSLFLTLKIEHTDLSSILLSLERHGLTIAYTFSDAQLIRESREHYDGLMHFLSI